MSILKKPLNTSHKPWCSLIRGGPEATCNCDGVPSAKQQLLAMALDRLVRHSKETLLLMESVKILAEDCVKEKEQDKDKPSQHADWCATQRVIPPGELAERGPCNCGYAHKLNEETSE